MNPCHNPFHQVCSRELGRKPGPRLARGGVSIIGPCHKEAKSYGNLQHKFALPKAKARLLADMDMVREVEVVRKGAHRATIDDAPRQSSKLHEGLLPSGIPAPVFPAEAVLLYADTVRALEDRGEDVFRQAV